MFCRGRGGGGYLAVDLSTNAPMDSNLKFQLTYGAPSPVAAAIKSDPNAPLFASEDGVVASLSNNECIFQAKRSGDAHVMTYQVLQALDQCREFRTLDEHIARIVSTIPNLQQQRDGVKRVLDSLIQRNLLVSDRDFVARLATDAASTLAPLRAVFIRACDRPTQLEHLLGSLADYERRFRIGRHYVVLDDSRLGASADRHRDLVREFARTTGCKLTYVGVAERAKLVERLVKAVPQARAALEVMLLPQSGQMRFGGGRSWNLALLLSAGARFVMLDDDQRLPLRRHELAKRGLDPNPSSVAFARFYRNVEEALGAGEELGIDPIQLHLDACGMPLGALTTQDDYAIGRDSLRGLNLGRLAHFGSGARVLATAQGAYGSSRTESGLWLYQLDADSRSDFWCDRASYLANIEAQHIWYGMAQARAANMAYFTPFAFDNSELLPCTNAIGRGEDALFSAVSHFLHPQALVLELPVAIGHVQETARKRSPVTLAASTPRFNHFVSEFVQRQFGLFIASDPTQRLHLLAELLRDVAGADEMARIAHLREYLNYMRADSIDRLQQQFEAVKNAPVYWQADVRSIIEANGKALIAKSTPRLGDWPEDADASACAAMLASELRGLADAWAAWPAAWAAAREQGERLLGMV